MTRGGAADQAVGRGAGDQLLELAAAALGGDREAPVLDEAARVDEVGDVLAGGAAAARVAPVDRVGPRRVLGQGAPAKDLGQVLPPAVIGRRISLLLHAHTICFRRAGTDDRGGEMAELARYELEDGIATITMDDGKVNALSIEMLRSVLAALDRAEEDGSVVVLTGRETYLSAGFDLKVFSERPGEIVEMLTLGARLSERVLSFPTPVLVACNGHAIAAGTFALLAADLRIGVEGPYKLGLNEVKIGLTVPLYVVELARQRLTPRDFNRSLTHRHDVLSPEAVPAGLLDRVVPAEELRDVSLAAAEELAELNMEAHAATKLRVRAAAYGPARRDRRRARAAGPQVNVLIAADMEGIAGIEDYGECLPSHPAAYARGRRLMTDEVLAVVEVLRAGGPSGSRSATGTWSVRTSNASACPTGRRGPANRRSRPERGRALLCQSGGWSCARRGRAARPPRKDPEPAGLLLAQLHLGNGGRTQRRPLSETQFFAQGLAARGVPILAASGDRWLLEEMTTASSAAPAWCPSRKVRAGPRRTSIGPAEAREKLADAVAEALAGPVTATRPHLPGRVAGLRRRRRDREYDGRR